MGKINLHESVGNEQHRTISVITEDRPGRGQNSPIIEEKIWKKIQYFSFFELLKDIFLPAGYPHTVSKDYINYQIWDTVQAFASGLSGALAARAVLEGVGVGDQTASVLGATITWLLKDGTGMVGRITFAWWKGTSLDSDCKRWRLYADIFNDLSFMADLLAPFFKPHTLPIFCFSSLLRSIVGVAGGATRMALTQHQSIANNMADVSAKDGSQETLVNLAALTCNLIIVHLVQDRQLSWILFFLFVLGHLYANYRAVKAVVMSSLNETRFRLLYDEYLAHHQIGSLDAINAAEPVLLPARRRLRITYRMTNEALSKHDQLASSLRLFNNEDFCIITPGRNRVVVLLRNHSSVSVQLKALFFLEYLEAQMTPLEQIDEKVNLAFPEFYEKLQRSEWNLSFALFNMGDVRYDWKIENTHRL